MNKTHIWQDLVNSDRQLAIERENKRSKSKAHTSKSLKKRKSAPQPVIDEDVNFPLIANVKPMPNIKAQISPQIPKIVVGNMNSPRDENSKL